MKNSIQVKNRKKNVFLVISVLFYVYSVSGAILFAISFSNKYDRDFIEFTATVDHMTKYENNTLIYTEENALPFRVGGRYEKLLPYEVLAEELPAGTQITVNVAKAYLTSSKMYVSSLDANGKSYLDLQTAHEYYANDYLTMRIIGLCLFLPTVSATTAFLIIYLRKPKTVETDLFTFLSPLIGGPISLERKIHSKRAAISSIFIILPLIPLIIFGIAGNVPAILVSLAIFLVAVAIVIPFNISSNAKAKKADIEFYDKLFSFSSEVLPDESPVIFPFYTTATLPDLAARFGPTGIDLINDEGITEAEMFGTTMDAESEFDGGQIFKDYQNTPQNARESQLFIPYEDMRLRTVAVYSASPTRIKIFIATDFSTDAYTSGGNDLIFVLDGYLYKAIKQFDVHVRGLDKALFERKDRMTKAKKFNPSPIYFDD